jgi:hypothetical protein
METRAVGHYQWLHSSVQTWLMLTVIALVWGAHGEAATKYNYTRHNTLTFPGAHNISLNGISFQRHLTGTFYDASGRVVSFHKVGKQETSIPLAGYEVAAQGINNDDVIVGHVFILDTEPESLDPRAFRYSGGHGEIFEDLWLWPADINTAGVEVGTFADPGDLFCYARQGDVFHAFVASSGSWCGVLDVNEATTAMAGWQIAAGNTVEGWVWTQQEGFKTIIIPGAYATFVENLSSDGSIQGTFIIDPDRPFPGFHPSPKHEEGARGFSMDRHGEITIIHVPGAADTYVKGGNARGDVVGTYVVEDAEGNRHWHGFIGNRAPPPKVGRKR